MAHARARGRSGRRPGNTAHNNGWLIFTRPEQHWFFRLLGIIVRARAELTLITITVTLYVHLDDHYNPAIILITLGATTAVVFTIPVSRRYVWRRIWCVITRRRIRACMTQTFTMARANGRLPFLLWARPSPVGEHITVWLPAGMAVKDLERITGELAAACWAKEARITPSARRAFWADVHIVRRDPLGTLDLTPEVIDDITDTDPFPQLERERAALAELTPAINRPSAPPSASTPDTTAGNGDVAPHASAANAPAAQQDAPDTTPDPVDTADRRPASRASIAPTQDRAPAVAGYGGLDVSDYV